MAMNFLLFGLPKTIVASALYFRRKTEQNQLGLLTMEREKTIPAPSDAFLFSLKCEYLELKETNSLLKQFWLTRLK